jgi:hypothetical protein
MVNHSLFVFSIYKGCVEQLEKSGCEGDKCFQHGKFSSFLDGSLNIDLFFMP